MVCLSRIILAILYFQFHFLIVESAILNDETLSLNQKVGESVQFNCTADGYPRPTVTWRKNGILVLNSEKFTIQFQSSESGFRSIPILRQVTSILTVNDVASGDAGNYSCRANNQVRLPVFSSKFELKIDGLLILISC